MAKFEIKFIDIINSNDNIKVVKSNINEIGDVIHIQIEIEGVLNSLNIFLDKSTAIKFAKTLRTEINKITESEVDNG